MRLVTWMLYWVYILFVENIDTNTSMMRTDDYRGPIETVTARSTSAARTSRGHHERLLALRQAQRSKGGRFLLAKMPKAVASSDTWQDQIN